MGNLLFSECFKSKPKYGPKRSIIIACQNDDKIGRQLLSLLYTKDHGDLITLESFEYDMVGCHVISPLILHQIFDDALFLNLVAGVVPISLYVKL